LVRHRLRAVSQADLPEGLMFAFFQGMTSPHRLASFLIGLTALSGAFVPAAAQKTGSAATVPSTKKPAARPPARRTTTPKPAAPPVYLRTDDPNALAQNLSSAVNGRTRS